MVGVFYWLSLHPVAESLRRDTSSFGSRPQGRATKGCVPSPINGFSSAGRVNHIGNGIPHATMAALYSLRGSNELKEDNQGRVNHIGNGSPHATMAALYSLRDSTLSKNSFLGPGTFFRRRIPHATMAESSMTSMGQAGQLCCQQMMRSAGALLSPGIGCRCAR